MSGLFRSESRTIVGHFQTNHFFVAFAVNLNANGTIAGFERIQKQIAKKLLHPANVNFHFSQTAGHILNQQNIAARTFALQIIPRPSPYLTKVRTLHLRLNRRRKGSDAL